MSSKDPFLLDQENCAFLREDGSRSRVLSRTRRLMLGSAIVLLACLALGGVASLEWLRWLLLQGDYSIVDAQVVKCRKEDVADSGPAYYVTYRYEVVTATGPVVHAREQQVNMTNYARLNPGQSVIVRHHNMLHGVSTIQEDQTFRNGISFGVLMWLPVTVVMGWRIQRCRREMRLSKEGQILEGRLIRCIARLDEDDDFKLELHYRFTAPGGRIIRAMETGVRNDLKDEHLPSADTPIRLLYLDEKNFKLL